MFMVIVMFTGLAIYIHTCEECRCRGGKNAGFSLAGFIYIYI